MNDVLAIVPTCNRMSDADYEAERATIADKFGDSRGEAGARFEQELARLFERSGWTQEELAAEEDKNQSWVSRQLQLAAFLSFMPTRHNQIDSRSRRGFLVPGRPADGGTKS